MSMEMSREQLLQRIQDLEKEMAGCREENSRLHAALHNTEKRFRPLLDFVPYPIAVFTMDGRPTYLNPSFTDVFGWTLEDLKGKKIPFVPEQAKKETVENLNRLYRDKILMQHESRRLTKDGKILEMSIRAAVSSESEEGPSGVIAIYRDITQEKRTARINEAMLHISLALPKYPDLEDLLDYVNEQIKRLLDTEGALVNLLDDERQEFVVLSAAYDATDTERRVKKLRFPVDQLVSGRVVKSGQPVIVSDTSVDDHLYEERDRRLGYKTRNLAVVPWRARDRIGGALCAVNKKSGQFEPADLELLEMIAGTVALSIENARVSEALKEAYREVSSLNRAKDKAINHLSHELRTPVSILSGSLSILARKLEALPEETWKSSLERLERNLKRIVDIQYEAADIMENKSNKAHGMLSLLLDQCKDELETLVAGEGGGGPLLERIRERIDEIFLPRETVSREMLLHEAVRERIEQTSPLFSHRAVEIVTRLEPAPHILIPQDVLQKVIDGLIRNAIENTPDEGRIEVEVSRRGDGSLLSVRDFGIGIPEEDRKRIFEGFFTNRDTMVYSTKRPFDFGAGGKGADLLRMKIFSERYGFEIRVESSRCRFIPKEIDPCPGKISECEFCGHHEEGCRASGGTTFSVFFPPRQGA
jgi:PAS domain S-box-containing protein